MTIYDSGSNTLVAMGEYCGDSNPPSHISSNKEMLIHFETDSFNGQESGFKLTYSPTSNELQFYKTNRVII